MRALLPDLPIFVEVATRRSFTAAGAALGLGTPAVSKAIRRLEAEVGAPLFVRTTRRVGLTEAGAALLAVAEEALTTLERGLAPLKEAPDHAAGELRVTLSFVLGRTLLRAMRGFQERYPAVVPRFDFDDAPAHLIDARIDVALRIGELPDSTLRARRLGACRRALVASPSYLAAHGTPDGIPALLGHRALLYRPPEGPPSPWWLSNDGALRALRPAAALTVDQGELLVEAACAGLGVAQVFAFMVRGELADGRLVELLPGTAPAGPPLHALWLAERGHLPRVRAFVDFAVELLTPEVLEGR